VREYLVGEEGAHVVVACPPGSQRVVRVRAQTAYRATCPQKRGCTRRLPGGFRQVDRA
jgi:hypothetical protein